MGQNIQSAERIKTANQEYHIQKTLQHLPTTLGYSQNCFRCQWLMPIILATWEAEIERITVQGQSRQIICEIPSPK
jgi:hypothetical protein